MATTYKYSAEKFPYLKAISGDRPFCEKSAKQCPQAVPDRSNYFLSEFFFRVSSCADCPTARQNQPKP